MARETASALIPANFDWQTLHDAAAGCRACDLWKRGTQTVFGEGVPGARAMFVGEQPGNEEDLAGRPFVGPAGRLLGQALAEAGIDRSQAYVTNVVKHFKWEPRGKRRIHAKPNATEVAACLPWLQAELQTVQPRVVVCLGATAAQALFGRQFRITVSRGQWLQSDFAPRVLATAHPSAILRARDSGERHAAMAQFVADLRLVARALQVRTRKAR